MKNLPYLDIHTHRKSSIEDVVSVRSLSFEELNNETVFDFTTAGIHPWWLEDHSSEEIELIKNRILGQAERSQLWAIGETGIDRTYPEFLEQQKELFYWHFELAEKYHLPLMIHNVRSGSDFLGLIKDLRPTTPWIFHDFRGNEQLVKDLLRLHSKCYFSFGLSIDNSPQIRELLPLIPLHHLFLETDMQKHLDIHDIYLRASELLKIDLAFLKSQIWMNFKNLTNP
ncbi:MAG: TatD family hydrolase [Bacteriovoracaceae bacterium]